VPHQIISLMQYPGKSNTLAMPEHWDHIEIAFSRAGAALAPGASPSAKAAHAAHAGAPAPAPAPLLVTGELNSTQWSQLITRIAALPRPKVAVKPSTSAIRDPKRP
jgi:hypothetical protein